MKEQAFDITKQLVSATVPAVLPLVQTWRPILRFINPQIADDMWPITTLVALVGGLGAYNLPRHMNRSWLVLVVGIATAIVSVSAMLAVTHGLISLSPAGQSFAVRIGFLFCFVGLALAFGWSMFWFLNPHDQHRSA
jgi:hypothetical protein